MPDKRKMASPSVQDTIEVLARAGVQLQRKGHEWAGPCIRCGGVDRFHISAKSDGSALIGCRGCIDGQGAAGKASYREINEFVVANSRRWRP